ncbi:MAG: hypothetical protein AABX85_00060 [Nanoarchaeota archaeon]
MRNKKAQVALMVIVAMVIVAMIIILFFILGKRPTIILPGGETNVQSAVEKCARDAANEAVEKMIPQGGFVEPENYKVYKNTKVSYLCQNIGYYKPCINQHPMFINEEIKEIKNYVEPIVRQCFDSFKTEMEKRNYEVSMDEMQLNVSLATERIYIDIDRKIKLTKNEQTQTFDKYEIEIINPIYDLSKVAIEIASQEAKFCYFEYVGYMILYPKIGIEKFAFSDSTKIYTIQDKKSKKEMNIAIRSCAIPPGI